jgi:hypothetical protein
MYELIEPRWLVLAAIAILLIGAMLIAWTVMIFHRIERIPWR